MQVFRHYFICIATVKLLQFFNFISNQSIFNKLYSNASVNRHEKVIRFMKISVNGKKNLNFFHASFSSLFHMHCYGQVTSIF